MFVNSDYLDYKYIVEISDNYIILTNQRRTTGTWQEPEEIDVIYQYIKPSILTIEDTITTTSSRTLTEIEVTDEYWNRADACEIGNTTIIIFFTILFFINMITRLFKKGGMFFGS